MVELLAYTKPPDRCQHGKRMLYAIKVTCTALPAVVETGSAIYEAVLKRLGAGRDKYKIRGELKIEYLFHLQHR